ncbi:hypothetical protein M1615_04850 [Patescibacteria group bacterium]|nr:hypothetical protein [Patescibacteria group bacterium]
MKKPALLILFLLTVILLLSVVRIYISNQIATSGVVLGDLEQKTEQLKIDNSELAQKVYAYSSLTNVAAKAYDLGYTDQTSDYVLSNQMPVAIRQ